MKKILICNPLFDKISYINNMELGTVMVLAPFSKFHIWWRKGKDIWLYAHEKLSDFKPVGDTLVVESIERLTKTEIIALSGLFSFYKNIICFSYAITEKTIEEFKEILKIEPEMEDWQSMIEDYELKDYRITIHKCELDDTKDIEGLTELQRYKEYEELLGLVQWSAMTQYKLCSLLNRSYGKLNKINDLLNEWKTEKIIILNSTIVGIDRLNCATYNHYNKKKHLIEDFNSNKIKHLAFNLFPEQEIRNVNKVVINIADHNPETVANLILECYKFKFDNSFGVVKIEIIITPGFEEEKIKQVMQFFENEKISWK